MVLLLRILAVLGGLGAAVHRLATQGNRIETKLELIVAKYDELNSKLDELKVEQRAAADRVAADFQDLRDQLANDPEDQAAIDAATARVQESIDALKAVDPNPNFPATGEPTTPGEEPSEPTDG